MSVSVPHSFVRYLKLEDAKRAIQEWDGAMYKEQRLLVEMSRHDAYTSNPQDTGECARPSRDLYQSYSSFVSTFISAPSFKIPLNSFIFAQCIFFLYFFMAHTNTFLSIASDFV